MKIKNYKGKTVKVWCNGVIVTAILLIKNEYNKNLLYIPKSSKDECDCITLAHKSLKDEYDYVVTGWYYNFEDKKDFRKLVKILNDILET